ncbi:hypothetical protein ACP70R_025052 [Stipagrostis hirtigluma subsp. patula]
MEPPEELPMGFMEPADPPSPSIFLELPPTPHVHGGGDDDRMLPYISHLLMEDTGLDTLLYQYPDDHPELLQALQPYAQILSTDTPDPWPRNGSVELSPVQPAAAASCYTTRTATVDMLASNKLPSDAEPCSKDMVSMAFFKGMEEASKYLPGGSVTVNRRGRKKRLDDDYEGEAEIGMGKSNKKMAAPAQPKSEEEATACEMLEKLMINGCDARLANADVQEPCFDTKTMETPPRVRQAVDLHKMLIRCAEAVSMNDQRGTADLLLRIRHHSSLTGDGTQRLAHFFAEGLEARLAGKGSQLYRPFMEKRASTVGLVKLYQMFMASTCLLKIQFLCSNHIIYSAITGRKKLHVVQYGVLSWFQWPDLLRQLARMEGGPPEVRLTIIETPQLGFRPSQFIEETGRRLRDCARQFGVRLEFRGIIEKSEIVHAEDLCTDPSEVLVVNTVFHLGTLMDESMIVDRINPRDKVLNVIRKMRPKVFVHTIVNGSSNTAFFQTRFRDALFYFSALFDMTDTVMPRDCDKRVLIEQFHGQHIMNIVACEGADRVERHQSYKKWQAQSQQAGLTQLPIDPDLVQMLKDKVKKECHKYSSLDEDERWLLTAWKGRVIYALSTWTTDDD